MSNPTPLHIAILDDYQDSVRHLDCFQLLANFDVKIFNHPARGLGQLAIRLAGFDVLIVIGQRTSLSAALLKKLPRLKLIIQIGSATDHIASTAAAERGIAICCVPDDPVAPAEFTWALIMAATRRIPEYAANLRDGLWQTVATVPERNVLGRVLKGQTLGIWGYGRIGRIVAGYGKAFGMRVVVWGSVSSLAAARSDGVEVAVSQQSLFSRADVLTLHIRLTDTTRACVSAALLHEMKTTALLVNTSHASLIADGALEQALALGHPGFAALDVFEIEPVPLKTTLLQRHNVLATPHLGDVEQQNYERYFRDAFQHLLDFALSHPA